MTTELFITTFVAALPSYSQHQIEAWFLHATTNAAFNPVNQPKHAIVSISDFAQNLTNDKKLEVSEELFHKSQTALFGTVTSIITPVLTEEGEGTQFVKHTMTQIMTSDNM